MNKHWKKDEEQLRETRPRRLTDESTPTQNETIAVSW
jgi:hypothetical protein